MSVKLKMYFLVPVFLFLTNGYAQNVDHWETVIETGDYCRYKTPNSDIGNAWKSKDFEDGDWIFTRSGIGFGDHDDNTSIKNGISAVYIRYTFSIEDKSQITSMVLDMDYDDGFIAYLNGVEVAGSNVGNPVSWNMELDNTHEANVYNGGRPDRFFLNKYIREYLKNGENVLAVEVHNSTINSSDFSSNVFLHVGLNVQSTIYGSTPDWFWKPVEYTNFNLPLVIINTNGQTIPDEPRIVADMGIIYNGEGKTNSRDDSWNEYSGKISIEKRGESSQGFKKKSYSIELQKSDGSNNNVSILGLPEENDFVFYGPYSDKTMLKNVFTYELFRRTGRWAPRTRYVEMILNGEYNGVYVLTEKLKRDENRVDIDKLNEDDVTAQEISGGYILRRDKKDKLDIDEWWTSPVGQPYHQQMWYEYFDPKRKKLTDDQADYIRYWMEEFDEVMSSDDFADPDNGYKKYIRTKSFIDMMFVNEISKGIDNYNFSTYFHKENDEDGGQLNAGPPWDYNLGYGNVNYGEDWDAAETYGWCYPQGGRTYWFERLMEDEAYRNKVYCRWTKFRDSVFSNDEVKGIIDSCVNVLGDAVDRNYEKYPILGEYFWPAIYWPDTYEEEVDMFRDWVLERLDWMDGEWYSMGDCDDNFTGIEELLHSSTRIYPNPSDFSNIHVEVNLATPLNQLKINIYNIQGRLIGQEFKTSLNVGQNIFQLNDYSHLKSGIYIYRIFSDKEMLSAGRISKY